MTPATLDGCTVEIDHRGLATLAITAADGEVWSYTLSAAGPAILDDWTVLDWSVLLTRLDSGDAYRVGIDDRGRWRCECPAWRYRKSKDGPRGCKHTASLRPLKRWMDSLMGRLT